MLLPAVAVLAGIAVSAALTGIAGMLLPGAVEPAVSAEEQVVLLAVWLAAVLAVVSAGEQAVA